MPTAAFDPTERWRTDALAAIATVDRVASKLSPELARQLVQRTSDIFYGRVDSLAGDRNDSPADAPELTDAPKPLGRMRRFFAAIAALDADLEVVLGRHGLAVSDETTAAGSCAPEQG